MTQESQLDDSFYRCLYPTTSREEDFITGVLTIVLRRLFQSLSSAQTAEALRSIFHLNPKAGDIGNPSKLSFELRIKHEDSGRIPDLTIRGGNTHIIVEAKVEHTEGHRQLLTYSQSLSKMPEAYKGLVFLTGRWEPEREKDPRYGRIEFQHVRWADIISPLRSATKDPVTTFIIGQLECLLKKIRQIRSQSGDSHRDRMEEAQEIVDRVLQPYRKSGLKVDVIQESKKEPGLHYGGYYFGLRRYPSTAYKPCLYIPDDDLDGFHLYYKKRPGGDRLPVTKKQLSDSIRRAFPSLPEDLLKEDIRGPKTTFRLDCRKSGYNEMDDANRITLLTAYIEPFVEFLRREVGN